MSCSDGANELASSRSAESGEQALHLSLAILPERFAVCQFSPDGPLPRPLPGCRFWSLTCTDDEMSLVLPEDDVPADFRAERGWRCLKILGILNFAMVGVLAALSSALALASVSVFVVSTYQTDYLLVRAGDLERAVATLRERGHRVR